MNGNLRQVGGILLVVLLLLIVFSRSAFSYLDAEPAPIAGLMITKPLNYSVTIENKGGIISKEFSNLTAEIAENEFIKTININIDKNKLGKGEYATVKATLAGNKKGKTTTTLKIKHSEGVENFNIPIEISSPPLSVDIDKSLWEILGEQSIESNKANELTVLIKNDDAKKYPHGKIRISSPDNWISIGEKISSGYETRKEDRDLVIETGGIGGGIMKIPFIVTPLPPVHGTLKFDLNIALNWSSEGDRWAVVDNKTIKFKTNA